MSLEFQRRCQQRVELSSDFKSAIKVNIMEDLNMNVKGRV